MSGSAGYVLSDHAEQMAQERGIPRDLIEKVMTHPDDIQTGAKGRLVLQGKVNCRGGERLLRLVVNVDRDPTQIVTVYLTGVGRYGS